MNGYTGKILRINLPDRKTSTIDTAAYEKWGGGHGMGSAIFFDLVKDKTIDGFDPANAVTIMTSPLTGTMTPGATARTEMQGIGVQSSPVGWFTRSNFGGRFGSMLKYAGWDGIVIEGAADKPVWVDIRNDSVQIKDASSLWGLDTWKSQSAIWQEVSGKADFSDWFEAGGAGNWKRSTQRPAVLCIGKAGENKGRIASVVHDAGHGAGQGGFGGIWGSKNLKAISVIGTGSVTIADPKALIDARAWAMNNYAFQVDKNSSKGGSFGRAPMTIGQWTIPRQARPKGCLGCHAGCRTQHAAGEGNETTCMAADFYNFFDRRRHMPPLMKAIVTGFENAGNKIMATRLVNKWGKNESAYRASDLMQQYGINAFELGVGIVYLVELNKLGVLGKGKQIDTDLPFERLGEIEFVQELMRIISCREGIGDDLAEGFYRAAGQWKRLEEDLSTGLLRYSCWGLPDHYDCRAETEWGYGAIMGDRDVNEHDFNGIYWLASSYKWQGREPPVNPENLVKIIAEKLVPYENNPGMLDYSTENIYSPDMAKLVAWHRHYTRFWKQSCLYCDFQFADLWNPRTSDLRGLTGEGEPKFFNAVTGKDLTFAEGMELGKKIWNLDNAIWSLQGRHRDIVHFAGYIYTVPRKGPGYFMTIRENGEWKYADVGKRCLDRDKFEQWKTEFYTLEGWDTKTGWPMRSTLEELDLRYVADELESNDKIGL